MDRELVRTFYFDKKMDESIKDKLFYNFTTLY